jgi:VCBS repeat protein
MKRFARTLGGTLGVIVIGIVLLLAPQKNATGAGSLASGATVSVGNPVSSHLAALVAMLPAKVPLAPTTCPPLTQGFWKNHQGAWKVTSLTLGITAYSAVQIETILQTPASGDASLILANQLVAASLNIANGTDPTPVAATIADANALLGAGPIPENINPSSPLGQQMVNDAAILDNYNNGNVTQACGMGAAATWVDVRIGDLNGDGEADIVARDLNTGQWWAAISNGSSFTTSLWATWSPAVTWVDVRIGDLNGDGEADIVGRDLSTGQWWAGLSTGSSFTTSLWATWSPAVTWVDVRIGDLNGDGKADIVGRDLSTGQWWAGLSTGSSFTTSLWATWSPTVTWADVRIGDLNGDGKADIVGRDLSTGQWWAGLSTGSSFTTSLWATWSPAVTWVDVQIGDVDGDGKADIVGRDLGTGQWWAGLSTGSSFTTSLWATWSP